MAGRFYSVSEVFPQLLTDNTVPRAVILDFESESEFEKRIGVYALAGIARPTAADRVALTRIHTRFKDIFRTEIYKSIATYQIKVGFNGDNKNWVTVSDLYEKHRPFRISYLEIERQYLTQLYAIHIATNDLTRDIAKVKAKELALKLAVAKTNGEPTRRAVDIVANVWLTRGEYTEMMLYVSDWKRNRLDTIAWTVDDIFESTVGTTKYEKNKLIFETAVAKSRADSTPTWLNAALILVAIATVAIIVAPVAAPVAGAAATAPAAGTGLIAPVVGAGTTVGLNEAIKTDTSTTPNPSPPSNLDAWAASGVDTTIGPPAPKSTWENLTSGLSETAKAALITVLKDKAPDELAKLLYPGANGHANDSAGPTGLFQQGSNNIPVYIAMGLGTVVLLVALLR